MDPLKYIFQKPMPTGKLAKWQILLSEFNIIYVTKKSVKGQVLADHLAENPVGEEYEPLRTYFPNEEVSFMGEDIAEAYNGWRMFFYRAANFKGVGVGAVLVSEIGQHYPVSVKFRFPCTNNMAEYESSIIGLNLAIDMNIQELLHADKNFIDPILVWIHSQPAYCAHIEEEMDGNPWFHDIKEYLAKGHYLEQANNTQKHALRRLSNNFFQSGGILYRRTPDLGLLRCVDAKEASKLLEEIHVGTCGPHMNGFVLDKTILRAEYFSMTMETECTRFILVAIDYFTKWVDLASYKAVTKKVIANFVRDRIVCLFGVSESIITDNAANLNSYLMKAICETFKIKHKNSIAYSLKRTEPWKLPTRTSKRY
ncbi:uncharacterized protein [Nicotiana sylvestris]|uniref:uncharacterized protein n=1 Tax=Nicotiana sylvestris TaxID=4096 RepID=UPI00388C95A9